MRKAMTACLLALTVCFAGSCGASSAPVLVRPGIEVPERPAMLPVVWRHNGTDQCLTDSEARALAIDPEIVLLDEPFKGLDETTRAQVAACLRTRLQGRTVILVTHEEEEVRLMGGTLLKMKPGGNEHEN